MKTKFKNCIIKCSCRKRKKRKSGFTAIWKIHMPFVHSSFYLKGVFHMVLPADKKVTLSVTWVDKKGNPAQIDVSAGPPQWSTTNSDFVSLQVDPGGMSAVAFGGLLGTAQVSVTADADLGDGVRTVAAVLDVEVVAGGAATGVLSPGPLEDQ